MHKSSQPNTMRRAATLIAGAGLCLAAGCGSVPDVPPAQPQTGGQPVVMGAHGPLSDAQIKRAIGKLVHEPGEAGLLHRHLAIEEAVADGPLSAGNRTQLLRDGTETFRAMFAAIKGARKHINLEYFIFEDVESDGVKLGDLLVRKRGEGVAVNIIYDSYGSGDTPAAFFDRLRQAGVNLVDYNPMNPIDAKAGYAPNDRDHRKILAVDGTTAIVGGVNLSTTYQSNPIGKSGAPRSMRHQPGNQQFSPHWRDTDLEIQGPAVAALETLFATHWKEQKGPALDISTFYPHIPAMGDQVVRVLGSTPARGTPQYYVTLLSAVRAAEKSVMISAAYFVPTHQEQESLEEAARRGVDVRLLVPDKTDSEFATAVAQSRYGDLLEAGVKIFETHGLVLHSKTAVIDGVWSVVGSSNFDHRSVLFNDEVDVVVLGSATAQGLTAMFDSDAGQAQRLDAETWEDRPLPDRMKALFARIWEGLL